MLYINHENRKELGLTSLAYFLLDAVNQNSKQDMSEYIELYFKGLDETIEELVEKKYIKFIKGTKKQTDFQKMRIGEIGKQVLEAITEIPVSKGDKKMFKHLCEMYLSHEDEERHIGNKKKTLQYTSEFRNLNNLSLHEMYWLCMLYLSEEKFTKKLEYIFFNSNKNRYGTFKGNIEDSPLQQYFDAKKNKVKQFWKLKIKDYEQSSKEVNRSKQSFN